MKSDHFIIFGFVFIFYLHSNILFSQSTEAVQLLNAGIESENSEKYDEAIAYFSMAITLEPNYYECYIHRGVVYRKINNYYRAIMDYTKILVLKNTSENYLNRAKVYIEMKEYDNALNDLNRALQLNDKSYDAYYNRGMIYYNKLEYDSSLADLQKCIDLRPDYKDTKEKLALIQKDSGDKTNYPIASSNQAKEKETKGIDRFKDGELHKEPEKQDVSDSSIAENNKIENSNVEIKEEMSESPLPSDKSKQQPISENIIQEKSNVNISTQPDNQIVSNNPIDENNKVENPVPEIKEELKEPVIEIKEELKKPGTQINNNNSLQISENIVQEKSNVKNYAIQVGAFANEINAQVFTKKVKGVFDYEVNSYAISGLFKIRIGNYTLNEALEIVKKIKESGFTDAFIVDLTK